MDLPEDWLEQLRAHYPRRSGGQGWGNVPRLVRARIRGGCSFESILAGTTDYRQHCEATGIVGTEFVRMAQTFYGPGCWFLEDWDTGLSDKTTIEIAKALKIKKRPEESEREFAARVKRINDERLKRLK